MHVYNDNNMQTLVFFFQKKIFKKKKTQINASFFFFKLSHVSKEDARFVMSINFLICIGIKLANAVIKSIRALRSPGKLCINLWRGSGLVSGC